MNRYEDELNPLEFGVADIVKEIEIKPCPIFIFYCPQCGAQIYEGVVGFDMEDVYEEYGCEFCGWGMECHDLWDCIFTLKGSEIYGVHGLFTNDAMTELDIETVVGQFLFQRSGHGPSGTPFYARTKETVLQYCKDEREGREYTPQWFRH